MIDITRNRNSYQKVPTIKSKCDNYVSATSSMKKNSVQKKATTTGTSAAGVLAAIKRNTTTTKSTIKSDVKKPTTTTTSAATTYGSSFRSNLVRANKTTFNTNLVTTATTTASNTTPTTTLATNPVRAANQNFFLLPEFKDHKFLKEECDLMHVQLSRLPLANGHKSRLLQHQQQQPQQQQLTSKTTTTTTTTTRKITPPTLHGIAASAAGSSVEKKTKITNYNYSVNKRGDDSLNNNNNNNNNSSNIKSSINNISISSKYNKNDTKTLNPIRGLTGSSNVNSGVSSGSGFGSNTRPLAAGLLNGMRRSGGGIGAAFNGSTAATTAATITTATANSTAGNNTTLHNGYGSSNSSSHYKPISLPKTTPTSFYSGNSTATSAFYSTAVAATPTTKLNANGIRQPVKLLIHNHRTIPATVVAAATSTYSKLNNNSINNNSSSSGNNNNYYNNYNGTATSVATGFANNKHNHRSNSPFTHQLAHSGSSNNNNNMHSTLDDIKFIDSDESAPPSAPPLISSLERRPNHVASTIASLAKTRERPKSTIMFGTGNPSVLEKGPSVFEKVNSYKYVNGSTASQAAARELRRSGIDSNSIKKSIEKFNSLNEQKRVPAISGVTLRNNFNSNANKNSGSTNNLQNYRHSTDLDNCNLRLSSTPPAIATAPAKATVKATELVTATTAQSGSANSSLTRPSYRATAGAFSLGLGHSHVGNSLNSSNTNSLPTKGSVTTKSTGITELPTLNRSTERASMSLLTPSSYKSQSAAVASNSNHRYQQKPDSKQDTLATKTATMAIEKKLESNDIERPVNVRSVLPPSSPTISRHWDRDRSSALLGYNNTDDLNKSSKEENSEGLCGLKNIGNTCFMNSVLQCISHTSELTKFLRNYSGTRTATKDQQILNEYVKLIKDMWSTNVHSVTPSEFKRAFSVKHRMYSDYNQQDAQEFLRFFLDALHIALNKGGKSEPLKLDDNLSDNKKAELTWEWYTRQEDSLIRELFVGQLRSTLRCTTCGNTSVTFDPFWDLSVSLPPSSSRCKLDACLDLFIREEVLDGDEMPTCSKCQTRRKCTKRLSIQKFPKYLVIHLKRFSETRWSKLSNLVEFPVNEGELNMGPYGSNNTNIYYSLYAVSNHMGSTAGGHYTALCKHPVSKKWHDFNDNVVGETNHIVSASAYILFYERS